MKVIEMSEIEWNAEGERRFGTDRMNWRFKCPCCGYVAAVRDWKAAGAPEGAAGFSCIGRWTGAMRQAFPAGRAQQRRSGPCDYAGGGLFGVNPVKVGETGARVFEFGDAAEDCGVEEAEAAREAMSGLACASAD